MDYIVLSDDGKEYGPVSFDELRQWVQQDRIRPHTQIKSTYNDLVQPASAIGGLFAPMAPAAVGWQNPPTMATSVAVGDGKGELWGSIIRSVLAVVFFFALHGIGLVFAGYALYYAIQCKSKGNRYGVAAIAIASTALVLVCIGWVMRMQSGAL